MNICGIRPGMRVRVKTFDELKTEGKITHDGRDFVRHVPFGLLKTRLPYLGGIFCVEKISWSSVYLSSCYYKNLVGGLIWWDPDLLVPVEDQKELGIEEDSTEFSGFLDSFEVVP